MSDGVTLFGKTFKSLLAAIGRVKPVAGGKWLLNVEIVQNT
jgi:hypothetical protein